MSCPNKNTREWIKLEFKYGNVVARSLYRLNNNDIPTLEKAAEMFKNNPQLKNSKISVFKSIEDDYNERLLSFFNITGINVKQINNMEEFFPNLSLSSAIDIISKDFLFENKNSISKQAVFLALRILPVKNKEGRVLRWKQDILNDIENWDKYESSFKKYKEEYIKQYPFETILTLQSNQHFFEWVKEKILIDFIQEKFKEYYDSPEKFQNLKDFNINKTFTRKGPFLKALSNLIETIKNFINSTFGKKANTYLAENFAYSLASSVLEDHKKYFNFKLDPEYQQVYYEETLRKDPIASSIIDFVTKAGAILTGSLVNRRYGSVFRSLAETVHDIDFILPFSAIYNQFKNSNAFKNSLSDKYIRYKRSLKEKVLSQKEFAIKNKEFLASIEDDLLESDFFKEFYKEMKATHGFVKPFNAFFGNDNKFMSSMVVQFQVGGTPIEKDGFYKIDTTRREGYYLKGDSNPDTGYVVDFFIRLEPNKQEHSSIFATWKEIFLAKFQSARFKDLNDWFFFFPNKQSDNNYNYNIDVVRNLEYKNLSKPAKLDKYKINTPLRRNNWNSDFKVTDEAVKLKNPKEIVKFFTMNDFFFPYSLSTESFIMNDNSANIINSFNRDWKEKNKDLINSLELDYKSFDFFEVVKKEKGSTVLRVSNYANYIYAQGELMEQLKISDNIIKERIEKFSSKPFPDLGSIKYANDQCE